MMFRYFRTQPKGLARPVAIKVPRKDHWAPRKLAAAGWIECSQCDALQIAAAASICGYRCMDKAPARAGDDGSTEKGGLAHPRRAISPWREDARAGGEIRVTTNGGAGTTIDYLTTGQAAVVFRRERDTITRNCARGLVDGAVKDGQRWLIPANIKSIRLQQQTILARDIPLEDLDAEAIAQWR